MQKFEIKSDLGSIALMGATAEKQILNVQPRETTDELPDGFSGQIVIKSVERIVNRDIASGYKQSSVKVKAVCGSDTNVKTLWLSSGIFAAIVLKNPVITGKLGDEYFSKKKNANVRRVELSAPVEISAVDVAMVANAMASMLLQPKNNKGKGNKNDIPSLEKADN